MLNLFHVKQIKACETSVKHCETLKIIKMAQNSINLGQLGENLATDYLTKKHYRLISRNFRKPWGELDIIAFDRKTKETVFFEVKTVRAEKILAHEQLTPFKLQRIKRTILSYLAIHPEITNWRFDWIGITFYNSNQKTEDYELEHINNIELNY